MKAELLMRALTDRGFRVFGSIEAHDTGTPRAAIGLILDLGTIDFANRGKQLDKVLVASRPRQLESSNQLCFIEGEGTIGLTLRT